jgi:hypothetical protein
MIVNCKKERKATEESFHYMIVTLYLSTMVTLMVDTTLQTPRIDLMENGTTSMTHYVAKSIKIKKN